MPIEDDAWGAPVPLGEPDEEHERPPEADRPGGPPGGRRLPPRAVLAAAGAAVAVVVVVVVILASGGGGSSDFPSTYPASAKANFLNGCEQRGSTAACTCELGFIEQHVPFSTFAAANKALINHTGGIPAWLLNAGRACSSATAPTVT